MFRCPLPLGYSMVTVYSLVRLPLVALRTNSVAVTVLATVTTPLERETPVTASFKAIVGVPVITSPYWLNTSAVYVYVAFPVAGFLIDVAPPNRDRGCYICNYAT